MPEKTCIHLAGLLASVLFSASAAASGSVWLQGAGGDFQVPVTSMSELRFHSVVRQERDFSCGSAALATLLTYHYGRTTSEDDAFTAMYEHGNQEQIRTKGFSMLDMKQYLKSFGFNADGFRLPLEKLEAAGVPAITLVNAGGYQHFVVIKGLRGEQVLVGDPALGLRVVPRIEFKSQWSGILFVIHSGKALPDARFNAATEWRTQTSAPAGEALRLPDLAGFTLSLPRTSEL